MLPSMTLPGEGLLLRQRASALVFVACYAVSLAQSAGSGDDPSLSIYFGCGCFWHVQHEFIEAERRILGRSDAELTALTGYAGGIEANRIGRACYPSQNRDLCDHELRNAEVVNLQIPRSSLAAFAAEYWRLFVGVDRVDVQDVGPEYRAVIGIRGGVSSDLLAEIDAAQNSNVRQTFELRAGRGGDDDTLGEARVWVLDSEEFPFYQAEVYHQFHDDMVERYPQEYNDLRELFLVDCRIQPTGCSGDAAAAVPGCPPPSEVEVESSSSSSAGNGGGSGGELDAEQDKDCPSSAQAPRLTRVGGILAAVSLSVAAGWG